MNRFLKIFSKENKEEKEVQSHISTFFETSIEQQLEFDKKYLAGASTLTSPASSPTKSPPSDEAHAADSPSSIIFEQNIPIVCQKFVSFFLNHLTVPGIFRTTGSLARVKALKQSLNHKYELHLSEDYDIQTIASCFKLWLRELTDGIVPQEYFAECMAAIDNRVALKQSLKKLPPANYSTLQFILEFLLKLSAESEINKMTISNIAIVFGPCLARINAKDDQLNQVMKETVKATEIIKQSLEEFAYIFDKSVDYIFNTPIKPKEECTVSPAVVVALAEAAAVKPTEEIVDSKTNDTTKLQIPFNPDEDSVSSIITDTTSPLNKKQKLELDTVMTSTIEDIISGSSSIQQRNKSITEGLVRSLSFEKSLTAEDALLIIPSKIKWLGKMERRNVIKRVETLDEPKTQPLLSIPSAPNRPAPVPHGESSSSNGSNSLISFKDRDRSSSARGSHSVRSDASREPSIRDLSHRKLPTRTYSENRSRTKSEKSLQEATTSFGDRKQSINSLIDSKVPSGPLLTRAATTHGTGGSVKRNSARSDPSILADDGSTGSNASKFSLEHTPSHSRKTSHQEQQLQRDLLIKEVAGAGPPLMKRRTTKKNGSSNLVKEVHHEESADQPASTEIIAAAIPMTHNIVEFILASDHIPALAELSKADVHQIKTMFRALHELVHSNMASSEEFTQYKKLKRVIKCWQASAHGSQPQPGATHVVGVPLKGLEESPAISTVDRRVLQLSKSVSSLEILAASRRQSSAIPANYDTAEESVKQAFNELKARKRHLQQILHVYQREFENSNGRPIKTGPDIEPMKREYAEYKSWRFATKRKDTRLENASWRRFFKERNGLKTLDPRSLGWVKNDCWLIGPLRKTISGKSHLEKTDVHYHPRTESSSRKSKKNGTKKLKRNSTNLALQVGQISLQDTTKITLPRASSMHDMISKGGILIV